MGDASTVEDFGYLAPGAYPRCKDRLWPQPACALDVHKLANRGRNGGCRRKRRFDVHDKHCIVLWIGDKGRERSCVTGGIRVTDMSTGLPSTTPPATPHQAARISDSAAVPPKSSRRSRA
jgi:hypothetical protein